MTRFALTCVFAIAAAFAAQADELTSTLTQSNCSTSCGSAPYGTITLQDEGPTGTSGAYVLVTETLNSPYAFKGSGSVDLGFQLSVTATSIQDLSGNFIVSTVGATDTIGCSNVCGSGFSKPQPGPLSFEIFDTNSSTGLTVYDFTASGGAYFTSDIGNTGTGNTGDVYSTSVTQVQTATPEPASLSLMLGALLLMGGGLRRKLSR